MPATPTTRLALPIPAESDANDPPADISALATKLDGLIVALAGQGAFSSLPAPGVMGRLAYATDRRMLVWDDGSQWQLPGWSPGDLKLAAGAVQPGWLICDGTAYSRSTYANLFTAIGTAFGAGDGSTTFNVPDLRGRVPLGAGAGSGLTARTLGQSGGEESHVLAKSEMPVHNHGGATGGGATGGQSASHTHATSGAGQYVMTPTGTGKLATGTGYSETTIDLNTLQTGGASGDHTHGIPALGISSDGSGAAHNVMQPFAVVNYLIKT